MCAYPPASRVRWAVNLRIQEYPGNPQCRGDYVPGDQDRPAHDAYSFIRLD